MPFDLYDLPLQTWPGHAGMYWDFMEYPPADPFDHRLIEMQASGIQFTHNLQTWINNVGEGDIWGVKTMPTLSNSDREKLIQLATQVFSDALYGATADTFKNPEVHSFRCDGLVEYCYEYVLGETGSAGNNGGIVANDTWDTLSPMEMWNSSRLRNKSGYGSHTKYSKKVFLWSGALISGKPKEFIQNVLTLKASENPEKGQDNKVFEKNMREA
ncbi:MAG TPA: hypothetical protein DEE98_01105 [Elusimicrobia bacterium]|nr:hypothetical protein [Elusimicrobiota bacterium]